mmetsp:Transcript_31444/g.58662  ORF Transcript_31444/g.58662 Transcript_31444/m.58662 type:complete len:115 (+) Transcript_31444:101-445(+)
MQGQKDWMKVCVPHAQLSVGAPSVLLPAEHARARVPHPDRIYSMAVAARMHRAKPGLYQLPSTTASPHVTPVEIIDNCDPSWRSSSKTEYPPSGVPRNRVRPPGTWVEGSIFSR